MEEAERYVQRMVEIRKRLGWSQAQLARALDSNQSTISRLEDGATKLRGPMGIVVRMFVDSDGAAFPFSSSNSSQEAAA